jgi:hypothetical protein
MTMEADFLSLLKADPGVAGQVADRISWSALPQGTARPAIVMHLIKAPTNYHLGGASAPDTTRVQVDCQSLPPFINAQRIGNAVSTALSGYAGTVGGTRFQAIFQDGAQDLSDTGAAEQQFSVYSLDFVAHHQPQE